MKKTITLLLGLMLTAAVMTGCTASAEQHTGEAQGYGGPLRVRVSVSGSDITKVEVISHSETEGVGTRAIDALPEKIAQADSVQVDSISGATVTSEAIKEAVTQAMTGVTMPDTIDMALPQATAGTNAAYRTGMGMAATGRLGPGEGVYSFNVVFAHGSFDEEGRVVTMDVDQLEVLSSQFDGFPTDEAAQDAFLNQVSQWTTKGRKGDEYMLDSASWRQQMDAYEDMMTGKKMEEITAWFEQNFDEATGKPAADSITGATMSLRDEHGDILTAIQRAWEDAQSRTQDSDAQSAPGDATMTDTNIVTEDNNTVG